MSWYRVFASHGPGHQSSSEFFQFAAKKLSAQGQKDLWHELFDGDSYDWLVGGVEHLNGLPEHVLASKKSDCSDSIKHANAMLAELRNTRSIPVIKTSWVFPYSADKSKRFQAQLYSESNLPDSVVAFSEDRDKAALKLIRKLKGKKKDYFVTR